MHHSRNKYFAGTLIGFSINRTFPCSLTDFPKISVSGHIAKINDQNKHTCVPEITTLCILLIVSIKLCASSMITIFPFNLIPQASRVA